MLFTTADDAVTAYLKALPHAYRVPRGQYRVTPQQICATVASAWEIDVEWLFLSSRQPAHAHPRMAAMALIRKHCKLSMSQIAALFDREHTMPGRSERRVADLYLGSRDFRRRYDTACDALALLGVP